MATLELRHLHKIYPNGDAAVRDLDVSIADGELFVLVGPSGCGKTTALRMVAGLEQPSSGSVFIDGADMTYASPQTRDIAMAAQHGALYPHMTVAENIGFPLKLAGLGKQALAESVRSVAAMLELTEVLDRMPGRLSGGQQQRVSMGRALIREPRLLLMDEPMSNLDAKLRAEGRADILTIQRRLGVTTLYVTHDQVEAMALADRLGVMRDGVMVQCGPPTDVYAAPCDLFVAQFMGSPPMNVVLGRLDETDGVLGVRIGAHRLALGRVAPELHAALLDRRGGEVAVGIRPEAFVHDDDAGQLTVSLSFAESLGAEQLVHAIVDAPAVSQVGDRVVVDSARTSTIVAFLDVGDTLDLWRPIHLSVDLRGVHFFDLTTGRPITG